MDSNSAGNPVCTEAGEMSQGPSDGGRGAVSALLLLTIGGVFLFSLACAQVPESVLEGLAPLEPVSNVRAFDTPNDEGGSITVVWSPSPGEKLSW